MKSVPAANVPFICNHGPYGVPMNSGDIDFALCKAQVYAYGQGPAQILVGKCEFEHGIKSSTALQSKHGTSALLCTFHPSPIGAVVTNDWCITNQGVHCSLRVNTKYAAIRD